MVAWDGMATCLPAQANGACPVASVRGAGSRLVVPGDFVVPHTFGRFMRTGGTDDASSRRYE